MTLPENLSDSALFFPWKRAAANFSDSWIILDKSEGASDYDLLYIDTNLDGSLADEQPIHSKPNTGTPGILFERPAPPGAGHWGPVKIERPSKEGPQPFHLVISYQMMGEGKMGLSIRDCARREGVIDMGGRRRFIKLIDNDADGRFNTPSTDEMAGDYIVIYDADNRVQNLDRRFLGRLLDFEGLMYEMTIAPDGSQISLKPAKHIAMGTIDLPPGVYGFSVYGPMGHFERMTEGERTAQVPAGRYRIRTYDIRAEEKDGWYWTIIAFMPPHEKPFEVPAKGSAAPPIGQLEIRVLDKGENGKHLFCADITTSNGDPVWVAQRQVDAAPSKTLQAKLRIRSADGGYNKLFAMEYG